MIIQIRGTSGSGKTTAMRAVLDELYKRQYVSLGREDGRKAPLYYSFSGIAYGLVTVLGHYEATCGGCDNIGSAAKVFELVKRVREECGGTILCEGLLLSEDTKWTVQMPAIAETRVIFLNTVLDDCLERVGKRRAAKGNDKPLNPANTSNRVRTIDRARGKLEAAGIYCRTASDAQTPGLILRWLKEARA